MGDVFPYLGITWLAKTASGGIFAGTFTSSVYRVVGLETALEVPEDDPVDETEADAGDGSIDGADDGTREEPRSRDSTQEHHRRYRLVQRTRL